MELLYDLWHLAFTNLIEQRAPRSFEVQSEVRLTIEPQRADILLLRRLADERSDADADAQVLCRIWPLLAKITIVEFKSPTRSSYRRGDLIRLWGYGPLYQSNHIEEVPLASDLTLLLVIPSLTPTLLEEIAAMGWTLVDLGHGYRRIDGAVYALYVAVTAEVAEAEHDEFLRIFSHQPVTDPAASWWLRQWMMERDMEQNIKDVPGFEEMFQKALDAKLAGLSLEQRFAGVPPEQRLAGLAPEQQILALSDETLRQFPDAFVSTLAPEVQQTIRQRLGRAG